MQNYVLSCCSTADLTKQHLQERNIKYLCFHYFVDDKEYIDDMFTTITPTEFYDLMRKGAMTKTSQVNVNEYYEYFIEYAKQNITLVHVTFALGLSGSYNSAIIAKNMVHKEYPDWECYVIDSTCASSGYGMFMDTLADKRDEGFSAKQLADYAEENKLTVRHEFLATELKYFVRGGRVSKGAGFIGSILKICPVLDVSVEGKLVVRKKARGKKNAIDELVSRMASQCFKGYDYDDKCYICHSDDLKDAEILKTKLENTFPNIKGKIKIYSIGTTIGSHSGPGTVALFYYGSKRTN